MLPATGKPIDDPRHIALLLPTRGRPEYLMRLFESLERTTSDKRRVDVWMYVDRDDESTRQFLDREPLGKFSLRIKWIVGDRIKTLGETTNALWRQCTSNAGLYMPINDKYLFMTHDWDCHVREAFDRYPDRILLAYPDEPGVGPEQVSLAILSAQWTNTIGRVFAGYFPFWYDDMWVDQVAQLIQRKMRLDIQIDPQAGQGKTGRMRNVLFWTHVFQDTLDERIGEADLLRKIIYPEGSAAYAESAERAGRLVEQLTAARRGRGVISQEREALFTERIRSGVPDSARTRPDATYLEAETDAAGRLVAKASRLAGEQKHHEALRILDHLSGAYQVFTNVEYLRAECLAGLGRHDDARLAALAELKLQPQHAGVAALLDELASTNSDPPASAPSRRLSGILSLKVIPVGDNPARPKAATRHMGAVEVFLIRWVLRWQALFRLLSAHRLGAWPAVIREHWRKYQRGHRHL